MSATNRETKALVTSLRLVFWGGLFCLFDASVDEAVNVEASRFSLTSDLIGTLMILWGVHRLRKFNLHARYRAALIVLKIITIFSCLDAVQEMGVHLTPPPVELWVSAVRIASVVATLVFCLAMRWLSRELGLRRSEKSWGLTAASIALLHFIVLGLFHSTKAIGIATETASIFAPRFFSPLMMFAGIIPVVQLLASISLMSFEADAITNATQRSAVQEGKPEMLHPSSEHGAS